MQITSTYTKRITTAIQNNLAGKELRRVKLASKMIKPPDLACISHIQRGKLLVPEVLESFANVLRGKGLNVDCCSVGHHTSQSTGLLRQLTATFKSTMPLQIRAPGRHSRSKPMMQLKQSKVTLF